MMDGKDKERMTPDEINELCRLNRWTRRQLALELGMTENIVFRWLSGDRTPGPAASRLMRTWLADARLRTQREQEPITVSA